MKKTFRNRAFALLFLAGLAPVSLAACQQAPVKEAEKETITLKDDLGREVTLARPKRLAVLIGSFADMVNEAGGKDLIVSVAHNVDTFNLDLNKEVADLGEVQAINQEALLSSQPDLVIASAKNESQKKMKDVLDQAGIPVVYYDVSNFDDYLRVLKQMTDITGDQEAYKTKGLDIQKEMEEVIQSVPQDQHIKVLALRETGKGVKAMGSKGNVLGEMLAELKTDNIAGEKGMDTLSMEYIVKENPQEIFYVAQGEDLETAQKMADKLFSQPAWKDVKAVKEGHVHVVEHRYYNLKPNANWAKALSNLEDILYGK